MATYQEIGIVRESPKPLLSRFNVAVERAAAAIFTEGDTVPNHANRLAWAKRAFLLEDRTPEYATRILRIALARDADFADAAVAKTVTDQQIQTIVEQYVNPLANAGL